MTEQPPGHGACVRQAFERFEGRLLQYARHLTGCEESARDVVQETFMKLCQSPPRAGELNGQLASWLYAVCRSRAIDLQRRARPLRISDSAAVNVDQAGATPSPATVAERTEQSQRIAALLAALPASQQEVVRLKFQQGLSYKEIAAVTGRTVNHVGVLLHTALKTLRNRMKE